MTGAQDTPDTRHMAHAIALGARALGTTAENPPVGCVIVAAGESTPCGVGWTSPGGRPHAEANALAMAGARARGGTAYVTLEPCSHHGRTPPCADALIAAGIARVVIACADPDQRVAGQGVRRLRSAGIEVIEGCLRDEAARGLAGFLSRVSRSSPHVMLKLAVSADGKIAARPGVETAITGAAARARVHLMRAEADAIMVGVSTVKADDPSLTCRLPGLEARSPVRIVSDSRLTIPDDARLLATARAVPVWILTTADPQSPRAREIAARGVTLVHCAATADAKVDLHDAMTRLAGRGINRLMAEGGAHMARALIEQDLVDEVALFTAPATIGPQGLDALAGLPLARITAAQDFAARMAETVGEDTLTVYDRRQKEKPMFTGIITDIGEVVSVAKAGDTRFDIATNYDPETIAIGASISCDGCCLTVIERGRDPDGRGRFAVEVSAETLSKTTLGSWREGSRINLERALRTGDELGGHIVSGHVDGVAAIVSITPEGDSQRYRLRVPDALARFIAPKGSISLNGTSLTVNEVEGNEFGVNIIPHTRNVTTWGHAKAGDSVNVEIDMLARYVARLAEFPKV